MILQPTGLYFVLLTLEYFIFNDSVMSISKYIYYVVLLVSFSNSSRSVYRGASSAILTLSVLDILRDVV